MNNFWNTMFAALQNTSTEEWDDFIEEFDTHTASEIDIPKEYNLQIASYLLDTTINNDDLVYAA